MNEPLIRGMALLALAEIRSHISDRDTADLVEAFYGSDIRSIQDRYEFSLLAASELPEPECWAVAWGAFSTLRGELKALCAGFTTTPEPIDQIRELFEQINLL